MTNTKTETENDAVSQSMDYLGFEMQMGMRAQSMGRDQNELVGKMRSLSPGLVMAYRNTQYSVHLDAGDIIVRIPDEVPGELSKFLEESGAETWAFISAYNPFSEQKTEEENVHRHSMLAQLLTSQEKMFYPATGSSAGGDWKEPSFFVLGLTYEMAKAIGTVFEQNAVLFGEKGAVIELVFCDW